MGVTSVALASNLIATGSVDGSVRTWDAETGSALRGLDVLEPVESVALSPDGRTLLSAGNHVKLWDVRRGSLLRDRYYESRTAAFRGNWIAAIAPSHRLSVWAIDTGKVAFEKAQGGDFVLVSPRVVLADGVAGVELWSFQGRYLGTLSVVTGHDAGIYIAADGKGEITGSEPTSARDELRCVVGDKSFSLELCEDRLVEPGLLAHRVAGRTP